MELSAEDNLRINVLLAQDLKAVRIDESKMIVYALTAKGEAKVPLNPNCKDDKYIKQVKAMFSTHVMGSPGGYPVFLKRWTRMGQARDESLSRMLLLGEEEAVVAAVHSSGLTDELAERAWWAMPTAENARRMLEKEAVVKGKTGPILAEFLIEFLPFEEEPHVMVESVRLVLQPGLISEETKKKLWARAKSKRNFYVGFLQTLPDELPEKTPAHTDYQKILKQIDNAIKNGNRYAILLDKVLCDKGQCFVKTTELSLKKPSNQEVVVALLEAIAFYFKSIEPENYIKDDIEALCLNDDAVCDRSSKEIKELLEMNADIEKYLKAMLILSCVNVQMINPIFARTDAIGSGMRKKIQPVTDPILQRLKLLQE